MSMFAVWTFGSVIWSMLVFFFWFMAIWVFVALFMDVLHRADLSGGAKAGWLLVMFVIPLLGCLIYIGARPAITEQELNLMSRQRARGAGAATYSPAGEIERLAKLRESGQITDDEYKSLKSKIVM